MFAQRSCILGGLMVKILFHIIGNVSNYLSIVSQIFIDEIIFFKGFIDKKRKLKFNMSSGKLDMTENVIIIQFSVFRNICKGRI